VPPDDPDSLAAELDDLQNALPSRDKQVQARVDEARWRIEHWFEPNRMIDEAEATIFGLNEG
jgi:hypothetical protein